MLNSILVGVLLTLATVGIHAAGTSWWIGRLVGRAKISAAHDRRVWLSDFQVLGSTAAVLLLLHIAEVTVWALAYLAIPENGLTTLEQSVYFSMVTYTSLGYGDIVLVNSWRMLSGIEAMTGVLIFGWSTALLFAVVQKRWESRNVG